MNELYKDLNTNVALLLTCKAANRYRAMIERADDAMRALMQEAESAQAYIPHAGPRDRMQAALVRARNVLLEGR